MRPVPLDPADLGATLACDPQHPPESIDTKQHRLRKSRPIGRQLRTRPAPDINDADALWGEIGAPLQEAQQALVHDVVTDRLVVQVRYLIVVNARHAGPPGSWHVALWQIGV